MPMNSLVKLTPLCLLLAFVSGAVCAVDFSVPQSVYKQTSSSSHRLSETAYRQFQPVQKQISAAQYDDAFKSLNRLVKRHKQNPYVVSVAIKTAAYIYISQQEYSKAMEWMQQILTLSSMSAQELQIIRHDLSQLQLQAEQYQNAINTMESWLQEAQKSQVTTADYQLLAVSHFQLQHYKKAKQAAQKGLKQPKPLVEPLYQLILACDFALKNYTGADKTLSILVKLNPSKKNYWIQWAGVLDLLEKPDKALVIFELMDKRQQLNNEQERIQFVQRLIQQDNAFKAANKLSNYIKDGHIITSVENQLLLALAWERSGESDKAITVLKTLTDTHKNDIVLTQLAQIYVTERKWATLVELLEPKLLASVTGENEQLYLQLGYGYVQLETVNKAKQTFLMLITSKQSSKEVQKSAQQWLKYLGKL
jgi:tetratricopeptide (TPR) repeat protein